MAVVYTQTELTPEELEAFESATTEFMDSIEAELNKDLGFWLMGETNNPLVKDCSGEADDV